MSAPKAYVTFNALAKRTQIPPVSLSRRIRALGIQPCAITVELGQRPSVLLFSIERLPELRRALRAPTRINPNA